MSSNVSKWIKLNVGGQLFQTTSTTLLSCPESLLAKMFNPDSGMDPAYSEDGVFFLDSNPKYFSVVLDWLRYKKVMADSDIDLHNVAKVADFFGIEELVDELKFTGAVVIFSDEGEATEFVGSSMGLYLKETGNRYRQAGGDMFLFQASSGVWHVNNEFNEDGFIMRNTTNTESNSLPKKGWEYWSGDEDEWITDDIDVIDAAKFKFCNSIVLSSTKYSRKEFLGEFRRVPHEWRCGWPIFKNKEGNYLGVFKLNSWSVGADKENHNEDNKFMSGNRITRCPAHVKSRISISDHLGTWQYRNKENTPWKNEITLTLKCDTHC